LTQAASQRKPLSSIAWLKGKSMQHLLKILNRNEKLGVHLKLNFQPAGIAENSAVSIVSDYLAKSKSMQNCAKKPKVEN
jgi:hypothetical protein